MVMFNSFCVEKLGMFICFSVYFLVYCFTDLSRTIFLRYRGLNLARPDTRLNNHSTKKSEHPLLL